LKFQVRNLKFQTSNIKQGVLIMKGIEAVKALAEKFGKPSKELLEKVKTDNKAIAAIKKAMKDGAQKVPEIAAKSGVPAHEVMWYMNALKKYGEVVITAKDEGFSIYELTKQL
jgi:hypothetical protein